jgi:hypothetical protein
MRRLVLVLLAGCNGSNSPASADARLVDVDADPPHAEPDARPDEPPTFSTEFADNGGLWTERMSDGGAIAFGVADDGAADGLAATLTFHGDPAFTNDDRVSPAFATELVSAAPFHFGRYRARVKVAACTAAEEVVTGIFTYRNDGTDADGDGLVDNDEIDIEVLCGTPSVIFLSSWTDYDETGFRKWTRAIDLATGAIYESPSDHEYGLVPAGQDPQLARPDLLTDYAELGFDWYPDRVRFVAVDGTEELTLWELTDAALVPQRESGWLFNVWHPGEHWFGDAGPPDHPAADAIVSLDRASYYEYAD